MVFKEKVVMLRKAILIASSKKGEAVTAAKNDVAFFNSYLISAQGGCWKKEEIIILINPSIKDLFATVNQNNEFFRLLYFSGHGCIANNKQYILLHETLIPISNLIHNIEREVLIFDCCRNSYSYKQLSQNYILKETINIISKKKISNCFCSLLKYSIGTIIFFTSSKNKSAFTFPKGSYFIFIFNMILKNRNFVEIRRTLSIITFFKLISFAMNKNGGFQTITQSSNNVCNYPFYMCL